LLKNWLLIINLFCVLCVLLGALYVAILLIYSIGWWRLPLFTSQLKPSNQLKITVLIPARNEAQNIAACLKTVVNQTYTNFEVIVIDDHSTDATAAIAKSFGARVNVLPLQNFITTPTNAYKKKAIEVGVAHATGELIVTTDADCTFSENWLTTIAQFYQKTNAQFIVLPVYIATNKSFISVFQSLDFTMLQGITGAAVHAGVHSMCNGANLAYTKSGFNQVNGFTGINHIASGDDMLLMHKFYQNNKNQIAYLLHPNVIATTQPVTTLRNFFAQRIRWASKANQYTDATLLPVLLIVYLTNVLLLIGGIGSFFAPAIVVPTALLLGTKIIAELLLLIPVSLFYKNTIQLVAFIFIQPLHILYTIIAGFLGKFGSYTWKNRQVQ
jgi:cellulose synthase/poly-beta-1,6-N-acetylglucosamine synthase-like glycosyltransferase